MHPGAALVCLLMWTYQSDNIKDTVCLIPARCLSWACAAPGSSRQTLPEVDMWLVARRLPNARRHSEAAWRVRRHGFHLMVRLVNRLIHAEYQECGCAYQWMVTRLSTSHHLRLQRTWKQQICCNFKLFLKQMSCETQHVSDLPLWFTHVWWLSVLLYSSSLSDRSFLWFNHYALYHSTTENSPQFIPVTSF